ncbi:uncharacterized protein [Watersipora subatra]|uniref:uncharacterized protein n=1 Tax=Watersipora subatra TaxID=2589382 RepID=UPI00355BB41C
MPKDPEYNSFSNINHNQWLGSWIAGTEYQTHLYGIFPDNAHDQNVPCARCHTGNRSALMMLPGKRTCPNGWVREYEGYLMTGARLDHSHMATYECVDKEPEFINGHGADTNGALLYFVKPFCSGMATTGHCPPYSEDRELTCVVCTK